ncbi:MAG: methylenetetrahydrofolate reductase C-terminal domain-containing protein [Chloroflexota bacterium]
MPIHTSAERRTPSGVDSRLPVLNNCPKDMEYGPCGGVGLDGTCEVDRAKLCVWHDSIETIDPDAVAALPQKTERPARTDSRFERTLRAGVFTVTCELNPHDSADATAIIDYARTIAPYIDAGHISDNSLASPHMCGLAVGARVQQAGIDPILHMSCRDRNRLMLQADLLGAHALGIKNILCITGDHPAIGDHPTAKPVFDFDSVRWIDTAVKLRDEGRFRDGERTLSVAPNLFVGGAVGPTAPPLDLRHHRLARKLLAGADFIVTQLIFDMDWLRVFLDRARDMGLLEKTYLLVGVGALTGPNMARAINNDTPGVYIPDKIIKRLEGVPKNKRKAEGIKICVEQIQQLMGIDGVHGIDIMDLDFRRWFPTPEIVTAAGLANRPAV